MSDDRDYENFLNRRLAQTKAEMARLTAALRDMKQAKALAQRKTDKEAKKAKNKAERMKRRLATAQRRREAGLCVKCEEPALPSKRKGSKGFGKFCGKHREAHLVAQRSRRGVTRPRIKQEELRNK